MHKAPDLPDVADDGPAVLIIPDDRNHRNRRISSRSEQDSHDSEDTTVVTE